jgi:hypothetical protein
MTRQAAKIRDDVVGTLDISVTSDFLGPTVAVGRKEREKAGETF